MSLVLAGHVLGAGALACFKLPAHRGLEAVGAALVPYSRASFCVAHIHFPVLFAHQRMSGPEGGRGQKWQAPAGCGRHLLEDRFSPG